MKIKIIVGALTGIALAIVNGSVLHSVLASNTRQSPDNVTSSHLDPQFLPITADELRAGLRTARTELEFFMLVRRGDRHNLNSVSIDVLRSLMQSHPKDGIYVGAFCFALQTGADQKYMDEYDENLRRAKFDGTYWLPLVLEGDSEMFFGRGRTERNGKWVEMDPVKAQHGFLLIRKAVEAAPNIAPTHYYLAKAYLSLRNRWNVDTQRYENIDAYARKAEVEIESASRFKPTMYELSQNQLWIDLFNLHNKPRALKDREQVLSEIPSEDSLSHDERKLLDMAKE